MAWGDGILTVYDMIKETIILLRSVVKRLKYIRFVDFHVKRCVRNEVSRVFDRLRWA
jgi:hypothetical protein